MNLRALALALLLIGVAGGATASAAEPPDQNDPCARGGRDTCGTTGKGAYRTYKFGPRWFGDYRGAVPGVTAARSASTCATGTPARQYDYEKRSAEGLRNRDGDALSSSDLRRMSFALWRFGRSDSATSRPP